MTVMDTRTGSEPHQMFDLDVSGVELGTGVSFVFENSDVDGSGPYLHRHPYDEIFVIRAGRARFLVGDDVLIGEGGMILVAPAGTPHRFEVIGPDRYLATHVHVAERIRTEWLDGPKAHR